MTIRYLLCHCSASLAVPLLLLVAPAAPLAQYVTSTNDDGTITITKYTGSGGARLTVGNERLAGHAMRC